MSLERCQRCEITIDTDFHSDCDRCIEELSKGLDGLLDGGEYDEAETLIFDAEEHGFDLSDTYEQDEIFMRWRVQSDWEQTQHDRGGDRLED